MDSLKRVLYHYLQVLAWLSPGSRSFRVSLHKLRGVKFEGRAFIGQRVILETQFPERIRIGDNSVIGIDTIVLAHHDSVENMNDVYVRIGANVFIGPKCVILPGVQIGDGAVVAAGSVVNRNIKEKMFVRGNPAENIAEITVPLGMGGDMVQFTRSLKPIKGRKNS